MAQYNVNLRDYWRIVKNRKAIIMLMVLLVGAFSYGFAKLKEPRPLYSAVAAIKIERATNMAFLLTGGFFTQGENLDTHAYIITSSPVLMKTAQALKRLPANLKLDAIRSNKTHLTVLEDLRMQVAAAREEGTNILSIEATADDPREAALLANSLARTYREFNLFEKKRKIFETKTLIEAQLEKTHRDLKAAEDKLQAFKSGYAGISMDLQNQNLLEKLNTQEKALHLIRLQREVTLQEALYTQLKTRYQETLINESSRVEEVSIVRPALVPLAPFNIPSKTMIVLAGVVMGLIIGVLLGFGLEVFGTSMGTIEDVESLLGVPVLGVIPFMGKGERSKKSPGSAVSDKARKSDLIAHYDPKSLPAEAFRTLRSNIDFMRIDKKRRSFLVTSSFVQEGKTFNAVNLALSMAQVGKKVLLIEADLRKPVIHQMFGIERSPGLADYILGNYTWQEVRSTITDIMLGDFELEEILRTPGLDNLTVIPAGTHPPNPAEILRSERFKELLQAAYKQYDMIFIDAPPVLPVADANQVATLVDGTLLVYTVGKIGRNVLKRAKITLDTVGGTVVGVVLNNVKPETVQL